MNVSLTPELEKMIQEKVASMKAVIQKTRRRVRMIKKGRSLRAIRRESPAQSSICCVCHGPVSGGNDESVVRDGS